MPNAARKTDPTGHGPPLSPGPGSPDVDIGNMPAWRALPAGVGGALESLSNTMKSFLGESVLTPANAAPKLPDIISGMAQVAAKAAADAAGLAQSNPAAVSAAAQAAVQAGAQSATIATTTATLTTAWTSASVVPGGQPAANQAFTLGIKAAAAAAASAVVSAVGGMADMHICSIPVPPMPHGPGLVAKGSSTVFINNLPAARQDDKVMEACGGADPVQMGCPTVEIGDSGGSGGGGGGGGSGQSGGGGPKATSRTAALSQAPAAESGTAQPVTIASLSVSVQCTSPQCAEPFKDAARDGSATVERDRPGCGEPAREIVDTGTHWIEIELVGEDDRPIPHETYLVKLPEGREVRGSVGADGRARIEGIKTPGTCLISFPNLDSDAWEELA